MPRAALGSEAPLLSEVNTDPATPIASFGRNNSYLELQACGLYSA